jgi:hypothetical protein
MEKMIAITGSLPPTSKSRKRLSQTIVHSLWDSLQHPPLSYLGEKFEYRTPDGSYNVRKFFLIDLVFPAMICF